MSDKKIQELNDEVVELQVRLKEVEAMLSVVNQKARIKKEVGDCLYGVVARWRRYAQRHKV